MRPNFLYVLTTVFAFSALVLPIRGKNWYVDINASGANNGTNWANAWSATTNVVWGSSGVKAGDTLYISGSSTGKVYPNGVTFSASGAPSSNITLRVGQDAGHTGIALMPAISLNTQSYITVNGAISDSFVPASNVFLLDNDASNRGIKLTRTNLTGNGTCLYMSGTGGHDISIKWVEIGPIGSLANLGDQHAVQLLNLSILTNLVFERCWIHDAQNDGINLNSVTTQPDYPDAMIVNWCIIERTGDDGIQSVRNGFTLKNSFLRDHWQGLYNGHPDQLQLSGSSSRYLKIINNVFRNKANSLIIGELYVTEGSTLGPIYVVGNVFYNTLDWYYRDIQAYGVTMDAWRPNGDNGGSSPAYTIASVLTSKIDGMHILHNTVYYQRTVPFKVGRVAPQDETDGDGRGTRSVWQLYITNSTAMGNVFINSKYNSAVSSVFSLSGSGSPSSGTNGVYYDPQDFIASNNVIAGVNRSMSYNGITTTSADTIGYGNRTNMPKMATNIYSFVPDSTDTVVRNQGMTLSALTDIIPELAVDLRGVPRGAEGAWDLGALEYSPGVITSGLVMRLTFADDMTDGVIDDTSPTGVADGLRFGMVATPTNWPTASTFTNPYSLRVLPAANFEWYPTNGYGDYSKSGDYVMVTNDSAFASLPEMSVFLWHVFDTTYGNTDWTPDNNATLIAADLGERGNWMIGRHGTDFPQLIVFTNNNANADFAAATWADRTYTPPYGYSRTWKNLGFTFSYGTVTVYSNGISIRTNFLSTVTNLTVRRNLALGCLTHGNHDPQLVNGDGYDQWPNNGWLNGQLSDVRIYNRVLNPLEVKAIVEDTESAYLASLGGGGGGGGNTNSASGPMTLISGSLSVQGTVTVGGVSGPN